MLSVSGPELVLAACRAGVLGAFPTANARSSSELDEWLAELDEPSAPAPYCANLIMRSPRLDDDLDALIRHGTRVVIASVGSPAPIVDPLRAAGCVVLADVATLRHAHLAAESGADGLVLLTAGAGGQTGAANPFAFVRAVRSWFDGLIVLAGGIADGAAVASAQVLGADLASMGTRFLATEESRAGPAYKRMVIEASIDDVVLTRAFTGLSSSMLRQSIEASGLDPTALDETVTPQTARELYGSGGAGPRRWSQVWSAGHSVSVIDGSPGVAAVVEDLEREYRAALRPRRT